MRSLIFIMSLFLSISLTQAGNVELEHRVLEGRWHKSGDLVITHDDVVSENFKVYINYELKPKGLFGRIIKPFLKGEYIFNFPENMLDERGYFALRDNGPVIVRHEDKVAILKYLEQVDVEGYQGAHKVEIRSKSTMSDSYPEGKWHIHLYYHPSILSVGIFKSEIFYHGKVGNYNVVSIEK